LQGQERPIDGERETLIRISSGSTTLLAQKIQKYVLLYLCLCLVSGAAPSRPAAAYHQGLAQL